MNNNEKPLTKFTLINLTDEIRKVDSKWQAEYEFHRKYSYSKEKYRNPQSVGHIKQKIDHYPDTTNNEEE